MFTSDLHLGHNSVCRFRSEFSSAEEHHNVLFDNLASAIKKRDVLFLLGDIAFDQYWLDKISCINCFKKVLILGNHDTDHFHIKQLVDAYDEIYSLTKKAKCWISHAPLHSDELRGKGNIHGHTHSHNIDNPLYYNVCPENNDNRPVELHSILMKIQPYIGK